MIILTPITSGSKLFFSATLALAFHVVLFGLIPEGRALPAKMLLSPYKQSLDVNLLSPEPVVRERVSRPVREKIERAEREEKRRPVRVRENTDPSRRPIAKARIPTEPESTKVRREAVRREPVPKAVRQRAPRPEERQRIEKKSVHNPNEGISRTVTYEIDSEIKYPRFAREAGMEGRVALSVHVSGKGRVIDVKVVRSSGYSPLDKSACRQVADNVLFRPAIDRGKPVSQWVEIVLNFSLLDGSVSANNK